MKKLLLSIGSMLFAGAILAGGTGAFLNDSGTSTGNTFASGVVNLNIDNESYYTDYSGNLAMSTSTSWSLSDLTGKLFYNFLDIKPGDQGEDTVSVHVNNNNAWACMNIKTTATPENGINHPESLVDTSTSTEAGELQNYLYFVFWADDGDNVYEKGEKIFKQGLTKDIFNGQNWVLADASTNVWDGTGPLPGDSTKYIGEAWCFGTMTAAPIVQDNKGKTGTNGPLVRGTGFVCDGSQVGNVVQSDGINANVTFQVAQSTNNKGYLCGDPSVSTTTPPVTTSTTTLFADTFNSCVAGKHFDSSIDSQWTTAGDVEGDNQGAPRGLAAFLDGKPTSTLTSINVNTTAYHNITLKYERNLDVPAGSTATLTVDYSVNGGTTWTTLESFGTDSDWTAKTWSLSPSADNKTNVKVRFTYAGTSANDHAYIDNVSITGITP